MRQLTLGIASGAWTFVGRPIPAPRRAVSPVQPDKAYILRLPQEIIVAIVEIIYRQLRRSDYQISFVWLTLEAVTGPDTMQWLIKQQTELARVHRFFYNAVKTFLYRSIDISILPQSRSTRLLHRTLQENPALGRHIRNLNLTLEKFLYVSKNQDEARESIEMLDNLFVYSAAARRLNIQSERLPAWPVILSTVLQNALAKLPFLETVDIWGESTFLVYTPAVYTGLAQAKSLQRLSVRGSYCSGRGARTEFITPSVSRHFDVAFREID